MCVSYSLNLCIITRSELFNDVVLSVLFAEMSRSSAISIATGCGLDDRGVGVGVFVGSRI
jgi:hypothetical protein